MADSETAANHWSCPKCGTQNASVTRLCYACGTADPDHVEPSSGGWLKAVAWFAISVAVILFALILIWSAVGSDLTDWVTETFA